MAWDHYEGFVSFLLSWEYDNLVSIDEVGLEILKEKVTPQFEAKLI